MPGFLTQALSMISAISDADITPEKVNAAAQETGVSKQTIAAKVQKVNATLSSTAGTRRHKIGRKARKTRKH